MTREQINLAKMMLCAGYLYAQKMISDAEYDRIHAKISRWQDEHRVEITCEQVDSIDFLFEEEAS